MDIFIDNVSYTYQPSTPFAVQAVSDVSIRLQHGQIYAIVGKTGSGKTTLLHLIAGLLRPTTGTIQLGEERWSATTKRVSFCGRVGVMFQSPEQQLFAETVYKDIAYGPSNQGFRGEQLDVRVRQAMALVDLDENLLHKSPFALSGGQQRRVAMAGVLAMEPAMLILDEPTAGLDKRASEQLLTLLQSLKQQKQITMLLVTHQMEEALRLADQMLVMEQGKLAFAGSPAELFADRQRLTDFGLTLPAISRLIDRLNEHLDPPIPTSIVHVAELVAYLEGRR